MTNYPRIDSKNKLAHERDKDMRDAVNRLGTLLMLWKAQESDLRNSILNTYNSLPSPNDFEGRDLDNKDVLDNFHRFGDVLRSFGRFADHYMTSSDSYTKQLGFTIKIIKSKYPSLAAKLASKLKSFLSHSTRHSETNILAFLNDLRVTNEKIVTILQSFDDRDIEKSFEKSKMFWNALEEDSEKLIELAKQSNSLKRDLDILLDKVHVVESKTNFGKYLSIPSLDEMLNNYSIYKNKAAEVVKKLRPDEQTALAEIVEAIKSFDDESTSKYTLDEANYIVEKYKRNQKLVKSAALLMAAVGLVMPFGLPLMFYSIKKGSDGLPMSDDVKRAAKTLYGDNQVVFASSSVVSDILFLTVCANTMRKSESKNDAKSKFAEDQGVKHDAFGVYVDSKGNKFKIKGEKSFELVPFVGVDSKSKPAHERHTDMKAAVEELYKVLRQFDVAQGKFALALMETSEDESEEMQNSVNAYADNADNCHTKMYLAVKVLEKAYPKAFERMASKFKNLFQKAQSSAPSDNVVVGQLNLEYNEVKGLPWKINALINKFENKDAKIQMSHALKYWKAADKAAQESIKALSKSESFASKSSTAKAQFARDNKVEHIAFGVYKDAKGNHYKIWGQKSSQFKLIPVQDHEKSKTKHSNKEKVALVAKKLSKSEAESLLSLADDIDKYGNAKTDSKLEEYLSVLSKYADSKKKRDSLNKTVTILCVSGMVALPFNIPASVGLLTLGLALDHNDKKSEKEYSDNMDKKRVKEYDINRLRYKDESSANSKLEGAIVKVSKFLTKTFAKIPKSLFKKAQSSESAYIEDFRTSLSSYSVKHPKDLTVDQKAEFFAKLRKKYS